MFPEQCLLPIEYVKYRKFELSWQPVSRTPYETDALPIVCFFLTNLYFILGKDMGLTSIEYNPKCGDEQAILLASS